MTLETIGATALLVASLAMVQARDTITRQEFEQAAQQLEQGAETGKISKDAARAGIEGLRRAMVEQDQGERTPREIYARAEAELREAVKAGKISEEDAKARLNGLRKRLSGDRGHAEGDGEDQRRDDAESREGTAPNIAERLKVASERLKAAVANGDLTADEAWAKWHEMKKNHLAPRIEAAVKEGKMSEQEAKAIWNGIKRAEFGEKLKAAVAAGEMSEQDARAKWEAFEKEGERKKK